MDLSNISILDLMPPNLAADKNIKMMAEAFDEVLRDIITKIPDAGMISNLTLKQIANEMLIDLLAWQFHVDFYEPGLPIEIKRELVLKSLDWHYRKGSPSVVEEIVSTVFTRAKIEEWYEYGGRPYRFRIATDEEKPDAEAVRKLIRAVNSVKNTRSFLDSLTHLLDFIDEVIIEERMRLEVAADFVETMEAQDVFGMKLDMSFVDHVYGRSAIVYGGIQGGAHYNGVHKHDGLLLFQQEVSRYKHNGEILFGSGLSDTFASEELETELIADFVDAETLTEALDPHTITLGLEDGVETDEELELSGRMDFSESAGMSDDFEAGMIGYWTYGDADNPKRTHDGTIGFNYGIVVPA